MGHIPFPLYSWVGAGLQPLLTIGSDHVPSPPLEQLVQGKVVQSQLTSPFCTPTPTAGLSHPAFLPLGQIEAAACHLPLAKRGHVPSPNRAGLWLGHASSFPPCQWLDWGWAKSCTTGMGLGCLPLHGRMGHHPAHPRHQIEWSTLACREFRHCLPGLLAKKG